MSGCGVILVLVVVLLRPQPSESLGFDQVVSVIKAGHDIIKGIIFTWNALEPDKMSSSEGVELPLLRGSERKVLEKIDEVSRQIQSLEREQQQTAAGTVHTLLREIPHMLRFQLKMDKLEDFIGIVNVADQQLKRYIARGYDNSSEDAWRLERHTLENFATWTVSHHPNAIGGVLERIHIMMVSGLINNGGLFAMLDKFIRLWDLWDGRHDNHYTTEQFAGLITINSRLVQNHTTFCFNLYNSYARVENK